MRVKYCEDGLQMCIDVNGEGAMNEDMADALFNVGRLQHHLGKHEEGRKNIEKAAAQYGSICHHQVRRS